MRGADSTKTAFVWFALALGTLLLFWPVLHHDFVTYDDPDYVINNPHVQQGFSVESVKWAFTTIHASNWHPITWLSHMLDWQFFADKAGGHHLVNLLLHIANTLLLFWLLHRTTGKLWPSAFVAGAFAWHPLHVESVAWIAERKDVLSAFFAFITISFYLRFTNDRASGGRHLRLNYSLALLFFAFGLMSKPMLVTLPFALLLLDYWPLQRFATATDSRKLTATETSRTSSPRLLQLFCEKLPFFALAAAASATTFLVQRHEGAVRSLTQIPFALRAENSLVAYVTYVGKIIWPTKLSVLYPFPPSLPLTKVAMAAVLIILVSALAIAMARRAPFLFVGWFWFLGTLVPVIGLIQVGLQSMADRYTYIPAIGIFIVIAWGAAQLFPKATSQLAIAGAAALLACTVLTRHQLPVWVDGATLFAHAIQVNPRNPVAQNNFANILSDQNRFEEAIPHYQLAIAAKPDYTEAHYNLGNALMALGRLPEAMQELRTAVKLSPHVAEAHNNLGNALARQGQHEEACVEFREAIKLQPTFAKAYYNLGVSFVAQQKFDEALHHYAEAIRLDPADADAHTNFGNLLFKMGRVTDALPHYQAAVRIRPDDPKPHTGLGASFLSLGQKDAARQEFEAALQRAQAIGEHNQVAALQRALANLNK